MDKPVFKDSSTSRYSVQAVHSFGRQDSWRAGAGVHAPVGAAYRDCHELHHWIIRVPLHCVEFNPRLPISPLHDPSGVTLQVRPPLQLPGLSKPSPSGHGAAALLWSLYHCTARGGSISRP